MTVPSFLVLAASLFLPTLLCAQDPWDTVPPRMGMSRYVSARSSTHAALRDRFVLFTLQYPEGWQAMQAFRDPQHFVWFGPQCNPRDAHPVATSFFVGPMPSGRAGSHEGSVAAAREQLQLLERRATSRFTWYRHDTAAIAAVNGLEAYEVRFAAGSGRSGYVRTVFGRFIVIPPGQDCNGLVLTLLADSGAEGVHSANDVGVGGGLGAMLNSLEIARESRSADLGTSDLPELAHYRQARDLVPEVLSASFVPFEFDYPAHWRPFSGPLLQEDFVQVTRLTQICGVDNPAEVFSVGAMPSAISRDSLPRVLRQEAARLADRRFRHLDRSSYRLESAGPVVVGGVDGYEVHVSALPSDNRYPGFIYHVHLIALPPTASRRGVMLKFMTFSLGVDSVPLSDVDREGRGSFREIVDSFRLLEK